jgi:hypothetical protein
VVALWRICSSSSEISRVLLYDSMICTTSQSVDLCNSCIALVAISRTTFSIQHTEGGSRKTKRKKKATKNTNSNTDEKQN